MLPDTNRCYNFFIERKLPQVWTLNSNLNYTVRLVWGISLNFADSLFTTGQVSGLSRDRNLMIEKSLRLEDQHHRIGADSVLQITRSIAITFQINLTRIVQIN